MGPLFLVSLILLSGCATGATDQSAVMEELSSVDASAQEIRLLVGNFTLEFISSVEQTSDAILGQPLPPEIRENTLRWKINTISTLVILAFQMDPMNALVDTWAFCAQMSDFLTSENGDTLFGQWQPLVVQTTRDLESRIQDIARSVSTEGFQTPESFVAEWVRDHPIDDLSLKRTSTVVQWASTLGNNVKGGRSSLANMEESVYVLTARLNIYVILLPKLGRWQAELLADERALPLVEYVQSDISLLQANVDSITVVFRSLNRLLTDERVDKLASADLFSLNLLEEMEARLRVLVAAGGEEAIGALEARVQELSLQLEAYTEETLASTGDEARGVVDHLFWRALILIVATVVLVTLSVVLLRVTRRSAVGG